MVMMLFDGIEYKLYNDNVNLYVKEWFDVLVGMLLFGLLFVDLWGLKYVWYFVEELFMKVGGKSVCLLWYQDMLYLLWQGMYFGNVWISFEYVLKCNVLEIVCGLYYGVWYDGMMFQNVEDLIDLLYGGDVWLCLLDIEVECCVVFDVYDILLWEMKLGDVLLFYLGVLYGGGVVDVDFFDCYMFVLCFFGDDVVFSLLFDESCLGFMLVGVLFVEEFVVLKVGDLFCVLCFC